MSANSRNKGCLYIFTYAPAGLGHLRVVNALRQGLSKNAISYLLGSDDKFINSFHRFTSIHPLTRWLMERIQRGVLEDVFTICYRWFLRFPHRRIHKKLLLILSLIRKYHPQVRKAVIISTHFGLAHRLAVEKDRLRRETGIPILLAVQVTDDTPQHIWYVSGADIIFVPSDKTKNELLVYGRKNHLPEVNFITNPYPTSSLLSGKLDFANYQNRLSQVDFKCDKSIHIAIPIPGAAVGLNYLDTLIFKLRKKSGRFAFHIIGKQAPFTILFINKYRRYSDVDMHVYPDDWEVVRQYDHQYQRRVISLEVTKPSEQAFKALLDPTQIGGSILLFSRPVGKQEYDNLDFLRRHHLIPSAKHQDQIFTSFTSNQNYSGPADWRGIILPDDPKIASEFIYWGLKSGLFSQMMAFRHKKTFSNELGFNGVNSFWQKIASRLNAPAGK